MMYDARARFASAALLSLALLTITLTAYGAGSVVAHEQAQRAASSTNSPGLDAFVYRASHTR